jgi:transposase
LTLASDVAAVACGGIEQLLEIAADANSARLPEIVRTCIAALGAQLRALKRRSWSSTAASWHRSSDASNRLDQIPGVGPALATALVATVADPKAFRSGRNFSAWIGLVPKQNSSGGNGQHLLFCND